MSCVHFIIAIRLSQQRFDASNYVLEPYLKFEVKFSAVLMEVSSWRHRLQCFVILRSFLRLLKLRKLVVCKLDLLRGGLTQCHDVLGHGLKLCGNIPLRCFILI